MKEDKAHPGHKANRGSPEKTELLEQRGSKDRLVRRENKAHPEKMEPQGPRVRKVIRESRGHQAKREILE